MKFVILSSVLLALFFTTSCNNSPAYKRGAKGKCIKSACKKKKQVCTRKKDPETIKKWKEIKKAKQKLSSLPEPKRQVIEKELEAMRKLQTQSRKKSLENVYRIFQKHGLIEQ